MRSRVAAYLWTGGGDPPLEYITLILCRDVYHCPPSALARERWADIRDHLICLAAEQQVREVEIKRGK